MRAWSCTAGGGSQRQNDAHMRAGLIRSDLQVAIEVLDSFAHAGDANPGSHRAIGHAFALIFVSLTRPVEHRRRSESQPFCFRNGGERWSEIPAERGTRPVQSPFPTRPAVRRSPIWLESRCARRSPSHTSRPRTPARPLPTAAGARDGIACESRRYKSPLFGRPLRACDCPNLYFWPPPTPCSTRQDIGPHCRATPARCAVSPHPGFAPGDSTILEAAGCVPEPLDCGAPTPGFAPALGFESFG